MKTPPTSTDARCTCDSRFLLPLGLAANNYACCVLACISCGTVTTSARSPAAENDPDGNARSTPRTILTTKSLAWLSRWPRLLTTSHGDFACLPSAIRCTSLRELEIIRDTAWGAQRALPRGRRFRRAGWPATPPPACLPSALSHYRLLWEAANFTPATDLDTLLHWANPAYALPSPFAIDALLDRADLVQLIPSLAHSPVLHRREVLCALARENASLVPRLLPHLRAWLHNHDRSSDSPRKRILAPEAETCRTHLLRWSSADNPPAPPLFSPQPALDLANWAAA